MNNVVTLNSNRNNNVNVFDFDEMPVRTIKREDGIWFVAADVCRALEIANPRNVIARLDEDEKDVQIMDTLNISEGSKNQYGSTGTHTREPIIKSSRRLTDAH